VLEVLRGEKSPADACRTYKIHNSVLTRPKREFLERAHQAFESGEQTAQEEGRIAELERMVGQLTMQLEILTS
jgi:transposase